jgi:hypothetical protein
MHIISFEYQPTMKVNIYNQCSDFKLIHLKYFSDDTLWDEDPDKEVDAGTATSIDFIPFLSTFEGALMYELRREDVESDDQSESTHILFLVAWKSEGYKKFRIFAHLIEYDGYIDWYTIRLREYYQRYTNQLCTYTGPIKNTWLLDNGTMMMTELELDFTQRDGVLNVTISEGIRDGRTKKPVWINPKR